jgi:hypothetical protein
MNDVEVVQPEIEMPTKSLLELMRESTNVASNTLISLFEQDEKLRESQATLATMEDNLAKTDTSLASIGSFWGYISTKYLNPIPPKEGVHLAAFERSDRKLHEQTNIALGMNLLFVFVCILSCFVNLDSHILEAKLRDHKAENAARSVHKGKSIADNLPYTNDPHLLKGMNLLFVFSHCSASHI